MPSFASIAVCLLIFSLSGSTANAQDRARLEPYTLQTFDGQQISAELGKLSVSEDRSKESTRKIEIAFVRLKSTAAQPGDPIVWLAGGPGVPGTVFGRIPPYVQLFDKLRAVSDVILLDQRGTGLSTPNLECKPSTMPADVFDTHATWLRVFSEETKRCADSCRRTHPLPQVVLTSYQSNAPLPSAFSI